MCVCVCPTRPLPRPFLDPFLDPFAIDPCRSPASASVHDVCICIMCVCVCVFTQPLLEQLPGPPPPAPDYLASSWIEFTEIISGLGVPPSPGATESEDPYAPSYGAGAHRGGTAMVESLLVDVSTRTHTWTHTHAHMGARALPP